MTTQGQATTFGSPLSAPASGGAQRLGYDEMAHRPIRNAHPSLMYIDTHRTNSLRYEHSAWTSKVYNSSSLDLICQTVIETTLGL